MQISSRERQFRNQSHTSTASIQNRFGSLKNSEGSQENIVVDKLKILPPIQGIG